MTDLAGRALLFVGGGGEALPGIRKAKEHGLHVVVSDMNPEAPGILAADHGLVASTYDVEETLRVARDYHQQVRKLDGVMCLATDVPLTVARVAAELGLWGIPVDVAERAMDKLAMKQKFLDDGVPIPWFREIDSVQALADAIQQAGYPLVIKPVDSRGGRGVLRLQAETDLNQAYSESLRHSPSGRVMVEQYLDGPQISTETIVLGGCAYTAGFSDRNYEFVDRYAPYFIENGGDMPSHLSPDQQQQVRDLVQQAAISLGVQDGVVKGDIVIHDGKPFVIELAARLSGGYFCTHEIPLNTGVDHVMAVIRLSLGLEVDPGNLQPRYQRGVSMRLVFPEPGRVCSVPDMNSVLAMEGVEFAELHVRKGDLVGAPTDSNCSAGVVIAVGKDNHQARKRAERAVQAMNVQTEPV